MTEKRLNAWQREVRQRGGSLWEILPLLSLVIVIVSAALDQDLMRQCLGRELEPARGRAAAINLVAGLMCSPIYAYGGPRGWFMLFWMLASVAGCAVVSRLEFERYRYWQPRRARANRLARERRAKARGERRLDEPPG